MSTIKAFIKYMVTTLLSLVCLSCALQPSLAQASTSNQVQSAAFETPLLALTSVTLVSMLVVAVNTEDKPNEPDNLEIVISKILKKYAHVSLAEATLVVNYVYYYAEKYSIRPALLLGIISAESSFKRKAVSSHGAMGYYQVMPRYHRNKIQGRNVFDTAVNIQVGAMILNDCFKLAGSETRALACYNGARTAKDIASYNRHISKHVHFFREA